MHQYTQQKEEEISALESRLERLKQDFEPYKAQEDINLLLAILRHSARTCVWRSYARV
ncbi:hypothetical protein [Akkermansia sp.]|uniref:hypothetical protein n=1 Tax=Akkermansia sp. TaxID=1872421 RepID=UPI0025C5A66D|nr:hypothetical protein [Akkermansia sp.]